MRIFLLALTLTLAFAGAVTTAVVPTSYAGTSTGDYAPKNP
ncbi:MAG: hypothetical protein ACT4N4_11215 [Rhodospirillales bacterium]